MDLTETQVLTIAVLGGLMLLKLPDLPWTSINVSHVLGVIGAVLAGIALYFVFID